MSHVALLSFLLILVSIANISNCQFPNFINGQFPNFINLHLERDLMKVAQTIREDYKAADVAPDASTVELCKKNGYPVEVHEIRTLDDYILTVHRIPHGRNAVQKKSKKPPVFVLHGNFQSSADWLINPRVDNCLGFILADAGYDVWLGNARGNRYSNKHVHFTTNQPAYWNFSMDEYGKYDIPATIDYILENTNKSKLHYIGFSLGNTHFYLALARNPQLSDRIALHVSYAPFVFFGGFPFLQGGMFAPFAGILQTLQDLTGGLPTPPEGISFLLRKMLPMMCNPHLDIIGLCRLITFSIVGYGPDQISKEQIPSMLGHLLTPTSLKGLIHTLQLMNNGEFTPYDYGSSGNLKEYGMENVPAYNLHRISVPIVLIRAPNDIFISKKVTNKLANNLNTVIEYSTVANTEFTHLDFCYGKDANKLVYNHTLELLEEFSNGI